jgi:hypothetical protein
MSFHHDSSMDFNELIAKVLAELAISPDGSEAACTESALARLCGVTQQAIQLRRKSDTSSKGQITPEASWLSQALVTTLALTGQNRKPNWVMSSEATDTIIYYAHESKRVNPTTARQTLKMVAKSGFKAWVADVKGQTVDVHSESLHLLERLTAQYPGTGYLIQNETDDRSVKTVTASDWLWYIKRSRNYTLKQYRQFCLLASQLYKGLKQKETPTYGDLVFVGNSVYTDNRKAYTPADFPILETAYAKVFSA